MRRNTAFLCLNKNELDLSYRNSTTFTSRRVKWNLWVGLRQIYAPLFLFSGVRKVLDSVKELCADADLKGVEGMFSQSPTSGLPSSKSQKEVNLSQGTGSVTVKRKLTQEYTEKQNLMASGSAKLKQLSKELNAEDQEQYAYKSTDRRAETTTSHQHFMPVMEKTSHKPPQKEKASNPYVGSKTCSTNTVQTMPIATRELSNIKIMERINPENWHLNAIYEPLRSNNYNGEYDQGIGGEMWMQNRCTGNSDSYEGSRMSPNQVLPQEICATTQNPVPFSLTQGNHFAVQQSCPLPTILHPESYSSLQTISQASVKRETESEQPKRKRLNC